MVPLARIWVRVCYIKIPIYPIFYLLNGDYKPCFVKNPGACLGSFLASSAFAIEWVGKRPRLSCFPGADCLESQGDVVCRFIIEITRVAIWLTRVDIPWSSWIVWVLGSLKLFDLTVQVGSFTLVTVLKGAVLRG